MISFGMSCTYKQGVNFNIFIKESAEGNGSVDHVSREGQIWASQEMFFLMIMDF